MANDAREWPLAYVGGAWRLLSWLRLFPRFLPRFVFFVPRAMKNLIARFWFTAIIAAVLPLELLWVLQVTFGVHPGPPTLATVLLFPVLFVVGTVIHFRNPHG